jgi:FAD/FMN-containing dehydrogenase
MSALAFFPFHGAVTRVAPEATAFSVREPVWDCNAVAQWTDPAESEKHIAWARQTWERIEPHTSGGAYINHLSGDDRPEKIRASYGTSYERLVALKAKYDPDNFFRLNPNIRPG